MKRYHARTAILMGFWQEKDLGSISPNFVQHLAQWFSTFLGLRCTYLSKSVLRHTWRQKYDKNDETKTIFHVFSTWKSLEHTWKMCRSTPAENHWPSEMAPTGTWHLGKKCHSIWPTEQFNNVLTYRWTMSHLPNLCNKKSFSLCACKYWWNWPLMFNIYFSTKGYTILYGITLSCFLKSKQIICLLEGWVR